MSSKKMMSEDEFMSQDPSPTEQRRYKKDKDMNDEAFAQDNHWARKSHAYEEYKKGYKNLAHKQANKGR